MICAPAEFIFCRWATFVLYIPSGVYETFASNNLFWWRGSFGCRPKFILGVCDLSVT